MHVSLCFALIWCLSSTLGRSQSCFNTTSVSTETVEYKDGLDMTIYYPYDMTMDEQLACTVFVHGGLWQFPGPSTMATLANTLVLKSRTVVGAIEYSLTGNGSCCSTDYTCNLGISYCNGKCNVNQTVTYPDFSQDAADALEYLSNYNKCDPNYLFCSGHSSGGQICTDINLESQKYFSSSFNISSFKGVIGLEGIYNLTKFYAGPKGDGWQCSIEKAFTSDGSIWCINGDNTCNSNAYPDYDGIASLYIHSPQDSLVLDQQAREMACRLNGVACYCHHYYTCLCLNKCLNGPYGYYSHDTSGSHFGMLNQTQTADLIADFICSIINDFAVETIASSESVTMNDVDQN